MLKNVKRFTVIPVKNFERLSQYAKPAIDEGAEKALAEFVQRKTHVK